MEPPAGRSRRGQLRHPLRSKRGEGGAPVMKRGTTSVPAAQSGSVGGRVRLLRTHPGEADTQVHSALLTKFRDPSNQSKRCAIWLTFPSPIWPRNAGTTLRMLAPRSYVTPDA